MIFVKTKFNFGSFSSSNCGVEIIEKAKVSGRAVMPDSCGPFTSGSVPADANNPGTVILSYLLVLLITRGVDQPQIRQSIIAPAAVYMVYLFPDWYVSVCNYVRHSVRVIQNPIYPDF